MDTRRPPPEVASASLKQALQVLVGIEVWSVVPGESGALSMRCGGRKPFTQALTNPKLTDEERAFDGEFSLWIVGSWRLELADAPASYAVLALNRSGNDAGR